MRVGRTCTADDLIEVLAGLVAVRGAPERLRMDNGPELLAWALRDYCRLSGTQTSYIEPGAPWENPYVESFNGRVRDELLNLEEFPSLTVAQVVVEAWRIEYNTYRPHSALGGLAPAEYAATWTSTNRGPINATYAYVTRPGSLPGATLAAWYGSWPWIPTIALALIFTPLLFPTGR